MPRWRRFVAVLLLLAFVPSSMLAAMPLVWCVGDDGHRAIEYAVSSGTKHLHHRALGVQGDDAVLGTLPDDDGCQDWQLMGKAKTAKAANGGVLAFDLRIVIALPTMPAILPPTSQRFWSSYAAEPPILDAQLAVLRSVVLLI